MSKPFSSNSKIKQICGLLVALIAICLSAFTFVSSVGYADDAALLPGNHPLEAEAFRQLGEASPNAHLDLRIHFALRNKKALAKLLEDQQNPASPNYHR